MESENLYKRLRNLPVRKSQKYMDWVKKKYPELQRHHLLGSMTGIKLNDFLLVPVTHQEHEHAERNKMDYAIKNLHKSLNLLFTYIEELEK